MEIREMVADIKTRMVAVGGLKNVYFIGCGGSRAAIFPGKYLLASKAKNFGVALYTSNDSCMPLQMLWTIVVSAWSAPSRRRRRRWKP
jgi:fructoselysine-6-P-deglycase FrlB-like protein